MLKEPDGAVSTGFPGPRRVALRTAYDDRVPIATLSSSLRAHTRRAHAAAERAGIMVPLLRGDLPLSGYRLLLANLVPIYEALEEGLVAAPTPRAVRALLLPGLARLPHLRADLACIEPADRAERHPGAAPRPRDEATDYARHLRGLAGQAPLRLAAHAYVRYLGDLSGGQVLARVVRGAYGPTVPLSFYAFSDAARTTAAFRELLDAVAPDADGQAIVLDEAASAFDRHVRLFEALAGTPEPAATAAR